MSAKGFNKKSFHLPILIASVLSGFLFSGCIYDPVYHGPPPYGRYHPHYYEYYYYPSASVYFHFSTGFYFYLIDGRWVRAKILPPHIHIDPYDRVRITVDSDKPYTRYREHKERFKPRPTYHREERETRSIKEKEANRNWYREYEQQQKKPDKQEKGKKDKDRKDKDKDKRKK